MKKMPRRFMRYVEASPVFVEAVRKARGESARPFVQETLDAFEDDPFLLYSCLWYAHDQGVSVLFQAPAAEGSGRRKTEQARP